MQQVEEFKLLLTPPNSANVTIKASGSNAVEELPAYSLPNGVDIARVYADLFSYLMEVAHNWFSDVTVG